MMSDIQQYAVLFVWPDPQSDRRLPGKCGDRLMLMKCTTLPAHTEAHNDRAPQPKRHKMQVTAVSTTNSEIMRSTMHKCDVSAAEFAGMLKRPVYTCQQWVNQHDPPRLHTYLFDSWNLRKNKGSNPTHVSCLMRVTTTTLEQ